MGSSPATARGLRELTAPEYVVLLSRGSTPADGPVVRAALVECVVRGLLRIERRSGRGLFRPRDEWHLVPGHGDPPGTLAPVLAAVDAAPEVEDAEGRRGRTVASVVKALREASDGAAYADRHVLPALESAGYVVEVKPPRWFRTSRFALSTDGEAVAADGAERVAAARAAVEAIPSRGAPEEVREARSAAAGALGAAGVLVIAEKDLLADAGEIRRALAEDGGSGGDATFLLLASGDTGSADDAVRVGDMFDAADAGAFDAADGGGSGGGEGGDGGGGGGD
ncbi:MAG: hypothetical protein ACFCVG_00900 [Kineosporiaceae bacterium]